MTRKTKVEGKFSTPIWTAIIDDPKKTNTDLIEHINGLKQKNPNGIKKSNNLGWHSPDLDLNNQAIKDFFQKLPVHDRI